MLTGGIQGKHYPFQLEMKEQRPKEEERLVQHLKVFTKSLCTQRHPGTLPCVMGQGWGNGHKDTPLSVHCRTRFSTKRAGVERPATFPPQQIFPGKSLSEITILLSSAKETRRLAGQAVGHYWGDVLTP
jgi:hypothetical protein